MGALTLTLCRLSGGMYRAGLTELNRVIFDNANITEVKLPGYVLAQPG